MKTVQLLFITWNIHVAGKLNPEGSIVLDLFTWEVPTDLPLQEFKYAEPNKVLANIPESMIPLVQKMIEEVRKYDSRPIVIDYKVRNLNEGDTGSAKYGYHLDCTNDIFDDFEPETHVIFGTIQGTHFVTNEIDPTGYKDVADVVANAELVEMVCNTSTAHKYTSKVLHNCPILEQDCQRLLIRVTAGFKDRIKHVKRR